MMAAVQRAYNRVCPVLAPPVKGIVLTLSGVMIVSTILHPGAHPTSREMGKICMVGAAGGSVCNIVTRLFKKCISCDADAYGCMKDVQSSIHPVIRSIVSGTAIVATGILIYLPPQSLSRGLPTVFTISFAIGGTGGFVYECVRGLFNSLCSNRPCARN